MKYLVVVLALLGLHVAQTARASILASATWTDQQLDATTYRYNITLHDTGTTNIGTFWFAWVPGLDFMPVSPTNVSSPTSWSGLVTNEGGITDGFGIEWTTPAKSALTPGSTLSGFQFDSHMTPAQFDGLSSFHPAFPVGTSFVYTGVAIFTPGTSFTVPEPSTFLLGLVGSVGAWAFARRRKRFARRC